MNEKLLVSWICCLRLRFTRGQHVRIKKLEEKGRKGSMVEDNFLSYHIFLDSVIKNLGSLEIIFMY